MLRIPPLPNTSKLFQISKSSIRWGRSATFIFSIFHLEVIFAIFSSWQFTGKILWEYRTDLGNSARRKNRIYCAHRSTLGLRSWKREINPLRIAGRIPSDLEPFARNSKLLATIVIQQNLYYLRSHVTKNRKEEKKSRSVLWAAHRETSIELYENHLPTITLASRKAALHTKLKGRIEN